ncbi:hypothetical protein MPRS_18370 [Mycobacterium paraseoulense]|nr:hypothetical protein MPRS_18370 [Mycobacterium paraseoulense]
MGILEGKVVLDGSTDVVRAGGRRVFAALRLRRNMLEFYTVLAAAEFGTVNS